MKPSPGPAVPSSGDQFKLEPRERMRPFLARYSRALGQKFIRFQAPIQELGGIVTSCLDSAFDKRTNASPEILCPHVAAGGVLTIDAKLIIKL